MSHFFTLLCKLIAVNINSKIVLPEKTLLSAPASDDAAAGNSYPSGNNPGSANDDLALPVRVKNPQRQRWLRFNIFSSLQINLAPVAIERPVFAYTTQTYTTTQTNRMKQILRAAKSSALCFFILLVSVFAAQKSFGQIALSGGTTATAVTTNTTTSTTLTIPKPSGLAAGHVMFVQIVQTGNAGFGGSALNNASGTGWTFQSGGTIRSANGDRCNATVLYRVATAADVTATNFSFSLDGNSDDGEGAIVAFSGVDVNAIFDATPSVTYTNISNTNSTITATAQTTAFANSAVVMFAAIRDNVTFSGWTTTSPGALTELYDQPFDAGIDMGLGAAWNLKAGTGSTGNGTATSSGTDYHGAIMVTLRAAPPPTITNFAPTSACAGAGTSVVITGTNFTNVSAVTFNNVSATFTVNSATQITATLPAAASTGTIKVTTPGGTATSAGTFTVNAIPSISGQPSTGVQTLCLNDVSTPLSITATAGSGSITNYQWFSNTSASTTGPNVTSVASGVAQTSYTPSTTTPGTLFYFCVVTNSNGCSITSAVSGGITIKAPPTNSNAGSDIVMCTKDLTTTLAANTPGVGTGAWSIVSGPSTLLSQFSSVSNASAVFTPAGGAGYYVLQWTISSDPCTPSVSTMTVHVNQTPVTPSFLNSGEITTYCNGTSVTGGIVFTAAPLGMVNSWTITNVTDVSTDLPASGTGNIPAFTVTNTTTSAKAAHVIVTITDPATTCVSSSFEFDITANPSPATLDDVTDKTYCSGNNVNIAFTGAITNYNWSVSGADIGYNLGSPDPSVNNILSFTAANSGSTPLVATFTITPRYTSGSVTCTSGTPKTFTITVNPKPHVAITNPTAICAPGTVDLTDAAVTTGSTTGLTYSYFTNAGATVSLNTPTAVAASGTYYIVGTNATTGCADTAAVSVTINALPTVTGLSTTPRATCINTAFTNSLTANATAGSGTITTYDWYSNVANSNSGGTLVSSVSSSAASNIFTPPATTAGALYYYCVVTNSNTCSNTSAVSGLYTVNPLPVVDPIAGPGSVCIASTIQLTDATAGGVWSSSATGIATVNSSGVVTGVAAGSATIRYTVTQNSCQTIVTYPVTVNATAVSSFTPATTQTLLTGGTVTFASTSANADSYSWNFPGGNPSTGTGAGPIVVTYNAAGTYTATLTSSNALCGTGTTASRTIIVNATTTLTGSGNFTVPANVFCLRVEAWGGGGAGGGTTSGANHAAGGGAGGAYTVSIISVNPGDIIPYTVGAGGTGAASVSGQNGGNTTFSSAVPVIANGGAGGTVGTTTTATGGATTTGTRNGGAGGPAAGGDSGGGGGGAGNTGNGTAGITATNNNGGGAGGSGTTAATTGGTGGAGRTSSGAGSNGTGLSAGGGGARNGTGTTTAALGGNGTAGQIIVSWDNISITNAPTITQTSLCAGTNVTLSGTAQTGAVITIRKNGVAVTTSPATITAAGGAWSATITTAIAGGDDITAIAQLTGNCTSSPTAQLLVTASTATPIITTTSLCSGATSVNGTSTEADGTIISVFIDGNSIPDGTTTVSGGLWSYTFSSALTFGQGVTAKADVAGKCTSSASPAVAVPANLGATGTINGTITSCANATGLTYNVAAVAGASNYLWTVPPGWTISSGQGTSSITVASGTTGGDITVVASNSCQANPVQTLTVSITPPPADVTVVGPASASGCVGTAIPITIPNSENGITYQLINVTAGNVNSGTAVTGNGGSITLFSDAPASASTITFSVKATNTAAGCSTNLTTTITVTVLAAPGNRTVSTPTATVCYGGNGIIRVITPITAITYTLRNNADNSIVAATTANVNGNLEFTVSGITTTTTFNVLATSTANGCTAVMTATPTITVTPLPTITSPAASTACLNSNVTYTTENGKTAYVWSIPGIDKVDYRIISGATNSSSVTIQWLTAGSKSVTVQYTSSSCTLISLAKVTTVNAAPVISGASTVCIGSSASLNASIVGGTWSSSNTSVVTVNGGTITGVAPGTAEIYYSVTDASGCTSQSGRTIQVNPLPVVSLQVSPATDLTGLAAAMCENSNATLTVTNTAGALVKTFSGVSTDPNTLLSNSGSPTANSFPLTISDSYLDDNNLFITNQSVITVRLNINHPQVNDLDIYLVSPPDASNQRHSMLLVHSAGGFFTVPSYPTSYDFTNTVISTSATNIIGSGGNNAAPFTGIYGPMGTLTQSPTPTNYASNGTSSYSNIPVAPLLGGVNPVPVKGQWSLYIGDHYFGTAADAGSFADWSLSITTPINNGYKTTITGAGIGAGGTDQDNSGSLSYPFQPPVGTHTYNAQTTDQSGCVVSSNNVTITVNQLPTVSIDGNTTVCYNSGSDVHFTGTPNAIVNYTVNGVPAQPVTLDGSGEATVPSGALTSNAVYSLVDVTTGIGVTPSCSQSATGIVTINVTPELTATKTEGSILCHGGTTTVTITATGGTAPYTNDGAHTVSAGAYSFTVTDANGCQFVVSGTITEPAALTATAVEGDPILCHGGTTTVTITATGGTAPYTNDGAHTVSAGAYSFTVTDANGCQFVVSGTITEPAALTATAVEGDAILCHGGTTTVTITATGGTAPYTNDGAHTVSAGAYSFTVTDANGCQFIVSGTITEPAALTATAVEGSILCHGGTTTVTITATGGTAPYTNDGAHTVSAGAYSFTVTDANGCQFIVSGTITEPAALTAAAVEGSILCHGGTTTVTITATGGTAPYTNDGAHTVSAGAYSFTVTDANGCQFVVSGTITEPAALTATAVEGSILCHGGTTTVTITATGGTAPYTNDGAHTVSAGAYSFTVTDANGCQFVVSGTITEPAALTATAVEGDAILCHGGTTTVTITATGGTAPYTNDGAHTVSAGAYSFTVTDANGCQFIVSGTITEPAALTAAAVEGSILCHGGTTTVTITATGGTAPYTNDGAHTVSAGAYSFTVTDANGCQFVVSGTITEPAASVSGSIASQTNIGCASGNITGSVTIQGIGGTGNYSYSDDGNNFANTSGIFNGLSAGTHTFYVRDQNGCTSLGIPVTITALAAPTSLGDKIECYSAQTLVAEANAPSGMNVKWYSEATGGIEVGSPILNTVGTVTYYAASVNNEGCESILRTPVTLTIKALPNAPTSGGNQAVCYNGNPTQTLTAAAGISGGTVVWYTEASGGTLVTNPVQMGVGTATYYAESVVDGCSSATRTAVSLTIYPAATVLATLPPIMAVADDGCNKEHISFTPPYTVSEHCSIAATGIRLNSAGQIDPLNTLDSPFPVGTTTIRWEANVNGQVLTSIQTVIVEDKTAPVPNVTTLSPITAECSATITTIPTATDDCAGTISATTSSQLSYNTPGTYTIVWIYNDGHGNTTTQTQNVTISDNTAPVPVVSVLPTLTGQCSVSVTDIPKATDNCAGTISATTTSQLFYNTPGTYQVAWRYDDGHGNAIFQFQTVTITGGPVAGTMSGPSEVCTGSIIALGTDGASGGTWSSDNNAIATVTNSGVVTGVGAGVTTIRYTVNGCTTSVATKQITVNATATAGTITGPSSVCAGSFIFLSTNGTQGGTWSSLTPAIATVNSFGVVSGIAPGTAVIMYQVNGCGNPFTIGTVVVNAVANAGTISGPSSVCTGASMVLTTNGTQGGTWSSSNNAVATVNSGLVSGISAGSVIITYTAPGCGNASTSFIVTVNAVATSGVISGPTEVCAGSFIALGTSGTPGGTWASLTPDKASVNSSGIVSGIAQGTAVITYTAVGCGTTSPALYVVTVNATANAGTIGGPATVCAGSSINLISTGASASGTWSSSNNAIATINASGTVSGVSAGSVIISYTISGCGNPSAQYIVTVNAASNAGTVSGASTVCAGSAVAFTSNGTSGGSWSSDNTAVAVVDAGSGLVTGVSAGTANIIYTTNGCGTQTASKQITVNAAVTSGIINGASSVCAGAVTPFTTTATAGGTWSSDNSSVAIVDASGVVTGVGAGTATITYTVTGCGTFSTTRSITVNATVSAGVISGAPSICAGSSAAFSSDGTQNGSWSSSNTAVAIVSNGGVVTGLGAGNATITYTVTGCGGQFSATYAVIVNASVNAGIVNGSSSVCAGSIIALSATGTTGGTWSSDNSSVAIVDAGTGVVTGIGAGTVTITYTVTGCGGPLSAKKSITVNTAASAGTIGGSATVCAGSVTPFSTNGTIGGTWSSDNLGVAIVDVNTGVVTGVNAGTATITYTVTGCGTFNATKVITVNAAVNAGVISGASPVCVGSSTAFSSNGTANGVWASDNTAVAIVSNSGIVTAIGAGTANITYTVSGCGGQFTASKQVIVNATVTAGTVGGTQSICAGSQTVFTATGTTGGVWSSDNASVATVDPGTGLVSGLNAGTANITYTVNGCGGPSVSSRSITVNAFATAGTITGITNLGCPGTIETFTTSGTPGGVWSSSNTNVVTVNPATGVVTCVGGGNANVIYSVNGCGGPQSTSFAVIVTPNAVAGIISGGSLTPLCPGSTVFFTTDGTEGGTWSSNNTAVATVNPGTGEISCIAPGSAMITYSVAGCTGPVTSQKEVSVSASVIAGVINGASGLCVNATSSFSSTGSAGGTWLSSDVNIAKVDAAGVVTGVAPGSATITYTVSGCNIASSTKVVTVNPSVTAGTISGSSSVCAGSTITLSSNGTSGGTWSSSNTGVATITNSGVVSGVSAGTVTITYTVTGCNTASATKVITVNASVNAGVVSGSSSVCVNSTISLSTNGQSGGTWSTSNSSRVMIQSTNGTNVVVRGVSAGTATISYTLSGCGTPIAQKVITVTASSNAGTISGSSSVCTGATIALTTNGTGGGAWSSSNTAIATVNGSGVVSGISGGTITISYIVGCNNATATKTVTVNAAVTAGTISGSSSVCAGSTITLGSDGTSGGTWTSSNTNIATVASNGVVSGIAAGNATITYTVSGCNVASATKVVTVNAAANAGVVSGASSVCINSTISLSTNGQSGGTWSTSNSSRVSIQSTNGTNVVVKGLSAGTATISYTLSGCGTPVAQKVITVNADANAGTISGSSSVCTGSTITLSSNGTSGGTWSSSNTNRATVTSSGVVTGVSNGAVTITYTVNGCTTVSATKSINVVTAVTAANTQIGSNSPVCTGSTISLTASGGSSYTWSGPNGFSSASQNPVISNATAAKAGTYSVVISNGSCSVTKTVNVSVSTAVGGTALVNSVASINTCYGNTVTVSLTGQTGNVTRWEYSTGNSGSWQTINTTQTTITRTVTRNTAFRAIVAISANCTPTTSSIANVTVTSTGVGGTVAIANTVVCRGSSAVFTLSGNTGSVLSWQYSTNGGISWTNVSNTSNTLIYSNATQNRRYRAVIRGCLGFNTVYSTSVAITVVNCNTKTTQPAETKTTADEPVIVAGKLEATAFPNPSQAYFNLQVKSSNTADVEIKVYDMAGKQVAQMRGAAYETYRFGNTLVAGTYIIEVRQGNEKVTTKIIKL